MYVEFARRIGPVLESGRKSGERITESWREFSSTGFDVGFYWKTFSHKGMHSEYPRRWLNAGQAPHSTLFTIALFFELYYLLERFNDNTESRIFKYISKYHFLCKINIDFVI